MGVWKDLRFAQFYGVANPTKTMTTMPTASVDIRLPPKSTKNSMIAATTAFLLRDAITIFGSFKLAPWFAEHFTSDNIPTNPHTTYMISQLVVPAMTQFFATPLHILGMDLYHQPRGVTFSERVARVGRDTPSITLVRSCRILPAFGAGVLCNTELRNSFRDMVQPM